jgi:hypothetical protein
VLATSTIAGMAVQITSRDLADMTRHWLECPVDGYLGSPYGSDVKAILQSPMAAGLADGVIAKAIQDIPLLQSAPTGTVNVYQQDIAFDKKGIVFEIAGELVPVGGDTTTGPPPLVPTLPAVSGLGDNVSQVGAEMLNQLINVTLPGSNYF